MNLVSYYTTYSFTIYHFPIITYVLMHMYHFLLSAGLLDTVTALNLSCYIREEREYVPWTTAIDWYFTWGLILRLTPVYGDYEVCRSLGVWKVML